MFLSHKDTALDNSSSMYAGDSSGHSYSIPLENPSLDKVHPDNLDELYQVLAADDATQVDSNNTYLGGLKLQFGRIRSSTADKQDPKMPLRTWGTVKVKQTLVAVLTYGFSYDTFRTITNSATLAFIVLAVTTSIFAKVSESSLSMVANSVGSNCVDHSNGIVAPYVASAMQIQATRGLNATAWNLEQVALYAIDQTTATYTNASSQSCNASNAAAENATTSMAHWSSQNINKLSKANQLLSNALDKIKDSLAKSGLVSPDHSNIPKVDNISVPSDYNDKQCKSTLNSSLIQSAKQNVNSAIHQAQVKILQLASQPIPVLKTTRIANCGKEYESMISALRFPTRVWLAMFSLLAGFCAIFYGLINYCVNKSSASTHSNEKLYMCDTTSDEALSISEWMSLRFTESCLNIKEPEFRDVVAYDVHSCIRGAAWRMLLFGFVLLMMGLADFTILRSSSKTVNLNSDEGAKDWNMNLYQIYNKFQNQLNDQCYSILEKALRDLNSNQKNLTSLLSEHYGFNIGDISPFSKGIAFDHVDFPMPNHGNINLSMEDFIGVRSTKNIVLPLLHQIALGFVISGSVLLGIWLLASILIISVAFYRARRQF